MTTAIEEKKHPWPHEWRDPPKKELGAVWCTNCRCFLTRTGQRGHAYVAWNILRAPRYARPKGQDECKHTTTRPVTQRWCTMCGYLESRAAEGPDAQPAGDGDCTRACRYEPDYLLMSDAQPAGDGDCTGAKAASGLGGAASATTSEAHAWRYDNMNGPTGHCVDFATEEEAIRAWRKDTPASQQTEEQCRKQVYKAPSPVLSAAKTPLEVALWLEEAVAHAHDPGGGYMLVINPTTMGALATAADACRIADRRMREGREAHPSLEARAQEHKAWHAIAHCSKCGRSRPAYIADPTCNISGYCDWVSGPAAPRSTAPEAKEVAIPLWLTCPCCGCLHIDEGEFATKLHHTHACQYCGLTWRPAIGPTVGVAFLPGFKNKP